MVPLVYAAAAVTAGLAFPRLENRFLPDFFSPMSASAAIAIYSSIASGMIALTGIVFSLTFVMVQFSATAYSPRLVLWVARDPLLSHSLGVFTATFLYAIAAIAWVDRSGLGKVPFISVFMVVVLLLASVGMFVGLTQRIGMLHITRMLFFTGDQAREVINSIYPPIDSVDAYVRTREFRALPHSQILTHQGEPRTVQTIDVARLTELATAHDGVIEMLVEVGDAVIDSTPLLRHYCGRQPGDVRELRHAITLGDERTFDQDPKYAIRLLVDIAIKALSPAVNDPTTAVQVLDHIQDLLLRLGRRRLEIGEFRDNHGYLRLVVLFPSWEDFLRLALDEIQFYGANSVQVMRRMKALINDLIIALTEERRAALRYWDQRLLATVARSFPDMDEKLEASVEDRQGLGIPSVNPPRDARNRT
jgi:uncharacterized membrane protein